MTTSDPLTIKCPDCMAPPGTPCDSAITDAPHAGRIRDADLGALTHGTCDLCGRPMVRGTVEDRPYDAWHPDPADAAACPPLPDPATDWDAYATAVTAGAVAGYPGVEHFVPVEVTALLCPECAAGKPQNCAGQALHPVTDDFVPCATVTDTPAPCTDPHCCDACNGTGGTPSGPCSDCYGTGHPHP